jgi:predicted dehydrogenase
VLALVRSPVARVEALGVTVLGGHEDMAQARVTFASGCIADLTASRVHPEGVRRMRIWAAEGFVTADFARRRLTLAQPAEHLRRGRIDSRRLDPATLASLKNELFTRHLQTQELDVSQRHGADQLTRELQEFVACVRTGRSPRVDGRAGREALALADAILDRIRAREVPAPRGWLFPPMGREAA